VSTFPSNADIAVAVRHLPMSLPYTRLFGAHFVFDDDTSPLRHPGPRERELERC